MSELFDALKAALADRYTLERELGRGGMATVYLAGDIKHRRKVAIKVLHPEIGAAIGPERFLREIEIAASLQHPHILPLYDSGDAAGNLYYVMPFVEGESLRDRLKRERQLPQEDVIKITSEVASALGYAHSREIVHRDIKPENIMLTGGSAVVADFGIARAASAMDEQQLTQTGTVVGTPLYMSPEQSVGSDIDGRSDEYSLACVVYEMLVGEPPFTGPNVQAIIARHSMQAVSPPSIIRLSIPETMERALLKALEKVPADRYPTVVMFAEAFATPSTVTAAVRRQSTTAMPAVSRPSVTLQVPVPSRHMLRWAIPVLVLLLAGWLTRGKWLHRASESTGPDPRNIAVLYFDDRSPGKSLGYLADGLTESLIYELGQVGSLNVISRYGVAPYKNAAVAPDSLARALKVGTVVEGTISQSGNRLRVTVDMINTANGSVQSSPPIEREREDVFGLQDALTDQVSQFLRTRLGQVVQQIQSRTGTKNAAAWELVERAEQERETAESLGLAGDTAKARTLLARADSQLTDAARMDTKWSLPIVNRGWVAYAQRRVAGWAKGPATTWTGRGLDFAGQALQVRPGDPEALRLRGTMRYIRFLLALDPYPLTTTQLLDSAEADLRAGGDSTNPNRASAWSMLSHLEGRKSDPAAGKLAALQALEADPYLVDANEVMYRLFSMSVDLEDPAGADRWCKEGRRRFPRDPYFTECQFEQMAIPGQPPDVAKAWQYLEADVALWPPSQRDFRRRRDQLLVSFVLLNAGLRDSADRVALRSRADATVDPNRELIYFEAMLRNRMGDRDESLRLLAQYFAANPQDRMTLANDESWWWHGVHEDPRFKQLVAGK
ncbi:MAG TPA: serine/threonine-protein kinase [Gemmatimonadales bacterium]|nr:serine/threonine-protein kinase [Gemmatimonadales bacterium]